jgi:WD40 repeat protein
LWDVHTGQISAVLEGHTSWVRSAVFSHDGRHIASGSNDKTVRLWDAHTGQISAVLEGHAGEVNSVVFSLDGRHVASGSDDNTVRLWDAHTGHIIIVLDGHTDCVMSVAFSLDGGFVTSRSYNGRALYWDISDLFNKNSYHPADLSHSHHGGLIHLPQSGGLHQSISWDTTTGWLTWQNVLGRTMRLCWLPPDHRNYARASAIHHDTVAIFSRTGAVTIIDFKETLELYRSLGATDGSSLY